MASPCGARLTVSLPRRASRPARNCSAPTRTSPPSRATHRCGCAQSETRRPLLADHPHPSSIAGGPYDGTTFSYIPGPTLNIDPSLTLHREWTDKIDPITYEVIRHNLWNINEELGMTIQRISGSPVAMYAFDLNSSIFTEDGEFIYYGPYQLYMSGVSDVQVKWTLEHRSKNPGIHADDMFLSNDPWVGAAHQMDVTLLTPVFHEGKLFCWITNVLHQYDV
ncbi:MAG: hypothetical protein EHM88_23990, partial [Candidatus Rokuibacteriota bacterium]